LLARRLSYLLVTCCLLVVLAVPGADVAAQGGSASLVLRFPAVKDFGGVQGKVLYVKQNLSASMPLRLGADRLEVAGGFFPVGRYVTALWSGSKLGSAVAGDAAFSVPISSLPAATAVAVVESERELPSVGWVFRGVPEWSPGKAAAISSLAGVVGDRLATLVTLDSSFTLAVFDGERWSRGAGAFWLDPNNFWLSDGCVSGADFWVAAYSPWYRTQVWYTGNLGATWVDRSPGKWGKYLRPIPNSVLFDDIDGVWSGNHMYRWEDVQSLWVDIGPSLGRIPYAQQMNRLYAAWGGMVKEYESGVWVDVVPLPAGVAVAQFAVCPDGTVWVTDNTGCTWRKRLTDAEWVNYGKPLGLAPAVLATMPDNSVWTAVNIGSNTWAIARWNGSVWVDMGHPVQAPGSSVKLFPGPGGSLYVLGIGHWYYGYAGQGLYELPCALEP